MRSTPTYLLLALLLMPPVASSGCSSESESSRADASLDSGPNAEQGTDSAVDQAQDGEPGADLTVDASSADAAVSPPPWTCAELFGAAGEHRTLGGVLWGGQPGSATLLGSSDTSWPVAAGGDFTGGGFALRALSGSDRQGVALSVTTGSAEVISATYHDGRLLLLARVQGATRGVAHGVSNTKDFQASGAGKTSAVVAAINSFGDVDWVRSFHHASAHVSPLAVTAGAAGHAVVLLGLTQPSLEHSPELPPGSSGGTSKGFNLTAPSVVGARQVVAALQIALDPSSHGEPSRSYALRLAAGDTLGTRGTVITSDVGSASSQVYWALDSAGGLESFTSDGTTPVSAGALTQGGLLLLRLQSTPTSLTRAAWERLVTPSAALDLRTAAVGTARIYLGGGFVGSLGAAAKTWTSAGGADGFVASANLGDLSKLALFTLSSTGDVTVDSLAVLSAASKETLVFTGQTTASPTTLEPGTQGNITSDSAFVAAVAGGPTATTLLWHHEMPRSGGAAVVKLSVSTAPATGTVHLAGQLERSAKGPQTSHLGPGGTLPLQVPGESDSLFHACFTP